MRTAHESVVGSKNDDRVLVHAMGLERFPNSANRLIDGVDLLVVLLHRLVVIVRVSPRFKPWILAACSTLLSQMGTIVSTIIGWLFKHRTLVNIVEFWVWFDGPMGGFETD